MASLAVALTLMFSSLATSQLVVQPLDYQEVFKQTFQVGTSAIRNRVVPDFEFTLRESGKSTFKNVIMSLRVAKAEVIPSTTTVLVRGVPTNITTHVQKFTIQVYSYADYTGTVNDQTVTSQVVVPQDTEVKVTLVVGYDDVTHFSAYQTEFDAGKTLRVLVRGAPYDLLRPAIQVYGFPAGTSEDVKNAASNHFAHRIEELIKTATEYTVGALNHL